MPFTAGSRAGRPRRRRFGLGAVAVVIIATVGGGVWWWRDREAASSSIAEDASATVSRQVVEVSTGTFRETVSAEGTVAAAETEDLSFSSAGTVTAVNVAVGDTVSAGRIVATIDSAELEATLAEAQATLADAEAKLADDIDNDASDEQIAADEANLAVAQDNLDDAQTALDGTRLTAGVSGTVTAVNVTVGEELGSGGVGGTQMTGSGSGTGNSASSLSSSTGAIPGATQGSTDTSSDPNIQIVTEGNFAVEVSVDSADVDAVAVDQQVTLTETAASSSTSGFPGGGGGFPGGGAFPGGDAFPGGGGVPGGGGQVQQPSVEAGDDDTAVESPAAAVDAASGGASATGTVTEVSAIADASSGVASYPVTIEFADDSGSFYIGTSVVAEIVTSERTDVIQVASRAITRGADGATVQVVTSDDPDAVAETRIVETGDVSGSMTEIVSGLAVGERVVVELPAGLGTSGQLPDDLQLPDDFQLPSNGELPSGGFPGTGQEPVDGAPVERGDGGAQG